MAEKCDVPILYSCTRVHANARRTPYSSWTRVSFSTSPSASTTTTASHLLWCRIRVLYLKSLRSLLRLAIRSQPSVSVHPPSARRLLTRAISSLPALTKSRSYKRLIQQWNSTATVSMVSLCPTTWTRMCPPRS